MTHFKAIRIGVESGEVLPQLNIIFFAIDYTKVDSTLTNFPVGIKITYDTNFMNDRASTDWQNIHAIDESDNECYVEVEKWDLDQKECLLWVRVPSVSSTQDTIVKIEMGAANTSYVGEPGDTPAQAVWDSDFLAVYHMSQDPTGGSGCIIDSTGNGYNGTPQGSMTEEDLVDGDFGKALEFDGGDDYILVSHNTNLDPSAITIDTFTSPASSSSYENIVCKGNNLGYRFRIDNTNTHSFIVEGATLQLTTTGAVTDDTWHAHSSTGGAGGTELWEDATSEDSDGTAYTQPSTTSDLLIGNDSGLSDAPYTGKIGEVRISKIVRTDAWIKATHYNLLGTLVSRASIYAGGFIAGIGFSEELLEYKEHAPVGISEGIGFSDIYYEDNHWFQGKYFGNLQNYDEDGTQVDSPTFSDYWVTFDGSNDGLYWDDNLDIENLDLKVVFRLDYTDWSDVPTGYEVIWKSGNSTDSFTLAFSKSGTNNMSYFYVGAKDTGVLTEIYFPWKGNFDFDKWYEIFVNPNGASSKVTIREYDNPSIGFTATGTITISYADYYESVGYSLGGSSYVSSTSAYAKCSVRSIDYYRLNTLIMPADLETHFLYYQARWGNNHDGSFRAGENGSPTMYDEWVTFDGNDAYYLQSNTGASLIDETNIDIKLTFRLEEDYKDNLSGHYTMWKIGNEVDGFEFGIKDRKIGFVSRNNGTLQTNIVDLDNIDLNVWYEAFLSTSKMTIREEASPSVGFTQSATVDVNAANTDDYMALASCVGGSVWEGSASSSWQEYTQMSAKELLIWTQGGLTFPSDLSSPVAGPIYRYDFGSSEGGTYGFSFTGSPTWNSDNVEGDGNDAGHRAGDYGPTPTAGYGVVVEVSVDTFSSAQVYWKVGDEVDGIAIGNDASGNVGVFARSSSSLTSITISASTYLSTATKYFIYATESDLKIYDDTLSLVAEATGSLTVGTPAENISVLGYVYGSPITGGTSTWGEYLDGRLYMVEVWEEADLEFPPQNWYHAEDNEIGFADAIDGDLVSAVVGISEGIGFNDSVGGDNVADTFYTEEEIAFDETIGGEQVATQKESSSTIGFNDQSGADHIDESSGEVDEDIAFNDTIDGYNATSHKGISEEIGFSDESVGRAEVKNIGQQSTLGFSDEIDAYNSVIPKESTSTLGFNEEIGGKNIIIRKESTSEIGFTGEAEVNITQEEGASEDIAFSDTIDGHPTTRNVGFSSTLGLDDALYGGNPLSPDNEGEIGFDEEIGAVYFPAKGISEEIGFTGDAVVVRSYEVGQQSTLGLTASAVAENIGNQRPNIPEGMTYKFYVTLTGANDSLGDYELPQLKTLQLQMKTEDQNSQATISMVYSEEAEAQIDLRPNGTLVIYMASVYHGAEITREELIELDFADARHDLGGTSQSTTIHGSGAGAYDYDSVYLDALISSRTSQAGRTTYKFARPNFYIKPGYLVAYEDERFIADEISFYMAPTEQYMEVAFDPETYSGSTDYDRYQRHYVSGYRYRKFRAILTGSADSKSDLEFSGLQSLDVRFKPGAPSYVSIVVAYEKGMKALIAERPNGDIEVYSQEGEEAEELFATANFNEVSYQENPQSRIATLTGYRTIQFTAGGNGVINSVDLRQVQPGGKVKLRSPLPGLDIKPMQLISYGGVTYLSGEIRFQFNGLSELMEMETYSNINVEKLSEGELGLTGEAISNTFYPKESTSEFGVSEDVHVSHNDVEHAVVEEEGIGFQAFIVAEKV